MIPNIVKGADMRGLLRYLQGPGRANEHVEPHVVAGDAFLMAMYSNDVLEASDATEIATYIEAPRVAFGTEVWTKVYGAPDENGKAEVIGRAPLNVWHASLSLSSDEGAQGNERWQEIAQDFMDSMGFTESSGRSPARWVAIYHGTSTNGNDHIHIAASTVREDGTKVSMFRDWRRAQDVCRELEKKYGLEPVLGREFGTVERGVTPAERTASERAGLPAPVSRILADRVRATAAASTSEAEWIRRVRASDMIVKPYFAKGTTDVVTGYRIALKPERYNDKLVFFGGKRLGQDLSLPRLREGWAEPTVEQAAEASAEWQAAFRGTRSSVQDGRESRPVSAKAPRASAEKFAQFNDELAKIPLTEPLAYADAARDVAGTLSAWSKYDPEHRDELRAAAQTLGRSASVHRRAVPQRRRVSAGTMGTALLFEQARHEGKGKIPAAIFMQQILKTATAIRDFQSARGNAAEAERIHTRAIARLQRIPMLGYAGATGPGSTAVLERADVALDARRIALPGTDPTKPGSGPSAPAPAASPLPRPLQPRRDASRSQLER